MQQNRWILLLTFTLSLTWGNSSLAYFYPDEGDLFYNGYSYVNSFMKWQQVGPFQSSNPRYEHDLNIYPTYFSSCTSWTTLPEGYDDCSTAGILDGTYHAFSFGTYDAKEIEADEWEFGAWYFSGGSGAAETPVRLFGQETRHAICPWDRPGCMDGVRSSSQLAWGHFRRRPAFTNGPPRMMEMTKESLP